jgi:hypothetical protein
MPACVTAETAIVAVTTTKGRRPPARQRPTPGRRRYIAASHVRRQRRQGAITRARLLRNDWALANRRSSVAIQFRQRLSIGWRPLAADAIGLRARRADRQ